MTHDQYMAELTASRERAALSSPLKEGKAEYDLWLEATAPKTAMLGRPRKAGPRKKQTDHCSVAGCHGKRRYTGGLCVHHYRAAKGIPTPMVDCACGCGHQAQRAMAAKNGGMRAICYHRWRVSQLKQGASHAS